MMQSSTLYEPSDKHVEYREYLFKVVMLGDASVGKTCLINRFCHGTFTAKSTATIGVDFKVTSRIIGETTVTLQIWDTAGQERFRKSMAPHYYRNAHGVIFVYDMTMQSSFNNLLSWINECKSFGLSADVPCLIVGNKCDEIDKIVVSTETAQRFADVEQMPLFETSAKDDSKLDNVESIFITLAYKMKNARSMKIPSASASSVALKTNRKTSVIKLPRKFSHSENVENDHNESCCR